jgi:hypothetical protein
MVRSSGGHAPRPVEPKLSQNERIGSVFNSISRYLISLNERSASFLLVQFCRMTSAPKQFFPCPLCLSPLDVRQSKKHRPHVCCDVCGLQLFVRNDSGIRTFQRLLEQHDQPGVWTRLTTSAEVTGNGREVFAPRRIGERGVTLSAAGWIALAPTAARNSSDGLVADFDTVLNVVRRRSASFSPSIWGAWTSLLTICSATVMAIAGVA